MAKVHGDQEAAAVRRQQAFDLRIAGASYRQIAKQIGVSVRTAFKYVSFTLADLDKVTKGKAERLREIELERCDKMILALWPKIKTGDAQCVRAAIAVMDRRAKLIGLDAPTKLEHGGPDGAALAFTLNLTKPGVDETV